MFVAGVILLLGWISSQGGELLKICLEIGFMGVARVEHSVRTVLDSNQNVCQVTALRSTARAEGARVER